MRKVNYIHIANDNIMTAKQMTQMNLNTTKFYFASLPTK